MKYFIIAGERSGDLHGSNLIKALKNKDTEAEIQCWGGDMMQEAGAKLLKHYQEISFMGFAEVLTNVTKIFNALKECKSNILAFKPDVVILIDFAGFNLRIAKFAKANNIKVFYYISPKVWAWNQSRANKIKALVDKMFVILPFEKEFYKKFEYEVDYVGNPLNDAVAAFTKNSDFISENRISDKPIIAILPGSRKQEVLTMLHVMVSIIPSFPEYNFVIAAVSNLPKEYYEDFKKNNRVEVVYDKTYDLLSVAAAAVVTSGTATLETALFEVPQVVVYKASPVTYAIAKALIKVKYISLVNLVAEKEVVKELIQDEFNAASLTNELRKILPGTSERESQKAGYGKIKEVLGKPGASDKAAGLMIGYLKN